MIELKLEVNEVPLNANKELKNSITKPFIYYLCNFDYPYLNTFVIVDFPSDKITYVKSDSKENKKLVKDKLISGIPHSTMPINKNEFLNIMLPIDNHPTQDFRHINLKEKRMSIYTSGDLGLKNLSGTIETLTQDYEQECFYIAFKKIDNSSTEYYKIALDLTKVEFLFDDKGIMDSLPHQVVRFKNFIVSMGWSQEDSLILIYNLNTKKIQTIYNDKYPSHSIIKNDALYYSSVNVIIDGLELEYRDPAIIGKLIKDKDELIIENIFDHVTGYRFTSHRYLDPDTIITIGYPNRIFFIDANTMELKFFKDIDKTILPPKLLKLFLNKLYKGGYSDPYKYSSFEISQDQKYIILFNQENIRLFNIEHQEIEIEIPFAKEKNYIQVTQHCDFLK